MFKINDTVVYGTDGVCTVVDVAEKEFNGTVGKYFVLKPHFGASMTIMVPMDNIVLVGKMHHVLSAEEAKKLISSIPSNNSVAWIEDEKKRKEEYRAIIFNGDRRELVGLIKTLCLHAEKQKAAGKKLHACDERFFKDAEKLLYEELAVALGIEKSEVLPYIASKLNSNDNMPE